VQLFCETDFVARNEDFLELAHDIAMHITAASPKYIKPEEVTAEDLAKEQEIWEEQLANEGKPKEMLEKILAGKEAKFRAENALLTQAFIKNPDLTVGELITEKIHKIGENIQVGSFTRLEM
jgi:elongation factor Ts